MSPAENEGPIGRMLALKVLPVLNEIDPDELAVIAERVQPSTFAAGDTVFAGTEAPVTSIHLVVDGRVVEHRGGRPFRSYGPQQVVGGIDALARSVTDVAAVAEMETHTLSLDRNDLRDLLEENFGILAAALQGVAATTIRLRRALVPSAGYPEEQAPDHPDPPSLQDIGARIAFLHAHAFKGARLWTLGQLARDAELVTMEDGAELWRQDTLADHGVIVVAGAVRCTRIDGGPRFTASRGTILGLEEALARDDRWYGAVAIGPTVVLRITRALFIDILEDDADSALETLAALAGVASRLRDRVAANGGHP